MEISGDAIDAGRTDDEQGKIVLLSLWSVGRLSFAIYAVEQMKLQRSDKIPQIASKCN